MQTPILFLGDSPSAAGGLSRIGRDLAVLVSRMDEFRVGFLGRGGIYSSKLPFAQYNYPEYGGQWGEEYLQQVWYDFAGEEKGIVFTIWDPSRLLWFANPKGMPNEEWLKHPPYYKWGYFPIDHEGPGGKLSCLSEATLREYDRVLAYGQFGSGVISRTLDWKSAAEWLPHGINMDTFKIRDGAAVRVGLGVKEKETLIGCIMTNQQRKDWGLAFEIAALLKRQEPGVKFWFKVDSVDRHWDLRALAVDFGVEDRVIIDVDALSDKAMSYMYSACDITMLPSLGEGFGYPIVESLACGTPVVHGLYAGGAELLPDETWAIEPIGYRYDTRNNCKRPVYDAADWVKAIIGGLAHGCWDKQEMRDSVKHLDWSNLYIQWQKWFREGLTK